MVKEFVKIQRDFGTIELLESEVCKIVFKDGIELKTSDLEQIHRDYLHIFEGKKYPILIVTGRDSNATHGARDYSAKKMEGLRTAEAFVCTTVYHKLLASLYYTLNKPSHPVKIFDNEAAALAWLKKFPVQ